MKEVELIFRNSDRTNTVQRVMLDLSRLEVSRSAKEVTVEFYFKDDDGSDRASRFHIPIRDGEILDVEPIGGN